MNWLSLCVAGLLCALPAVYSQALTVGFEQLNYAVASGGSAQACVAVQSGSIAGRQISVGYFTVPGTATSPADFTSTSGVLLFNAQNPGPLCITVPIVNNGDGEFSLFIFNQLNNPDLSESPGSATITITGGGTGPTPVTIGFQLSTYGVVEGGNVLVCAQVQNNQQVDREIIFSFSTSPGSATAGVDYDSFSASLSFGSGNDQQLMCMNVQTIEDTFVEGAESLSVVLATSAAGVTLSPGAATITIQDNDVGSNPCSSNPCDINAVCTQIGSTNGFTCACLPGFIGNGNTCVSNNPCSSNPCDVNAVCTQIGSTNGFTCACRPGFIGNGNTCVAMGGGDDPHFSIILPSGKLLCFTVQGERDFAFNLISTDRVDINALFVADSVREEVTWMGALGIIVQGENYYGANKTSLRFDAKTKTVSVGNKLTLKAAGVDTLHFKNGKLMITEKGPEDKGNDLEHPSVCVNLEDVGLHFHVTFFGEHLDIFWNSVTIDNEGNKHVHGLVGQFFRDGVKIDTVRKFLLLPKMEPVPIMRRPIWGFMERKVEDDQLCWTAMNAGYQGDGLIQGNYLNYLVDDVLDDGFIFKM
ncbi:uncharacterized protein LOC135336475 [Halichondria panicea]|uniref:uncharacterized protein LOC135336475 n=1 Tax=Halichondria panicea TaxID=6063 RepID=UPI00312B436E